MAKKAVNQIKRPKTKRYKRLRVLSILNTVFLLLNIFLYFWVAGPGVLKSQAEEIGACLKICASGQGCNWSANECQNLLTPPAPEEEQEQEQVQEQETTVVPGSVAPVSPLTTPVGIVPPAEIQKVLVPAEATQTVYQRIYQISSPELGQVATSEGQAASVPQGSTYNLTFSGKTNIQNAIIIITLTSPEKFYATTLADSQGNWRWTVPQSLAAGFHHLTVLAMSPSHASVRVVYELGFYVEAAAEVVSPAPVSPLQLPEILPPVKLPPAEITEKFYILDLKVEGVGEKIEPASQLNLVTDILSFNPSLEEEVTLTFRITDSAGKVVFFDQDLLKVKVSAAVIKRLGLTPGIEPGNYVASVKLEKDGVIYLSSVGFAVEKAEKEILVTLPGRITIERQEAKKGLFTSSVFLSLLLTMFLILLAREYQKAKQETQVSDQDLLQGGQIV